MDTNAMTILNFVDEVTVNHIFENPSFAKSGTIKETRKIKLSTKEEKAPAFVLTPNPTKGEVKIFLADLEHVEEGCTYILLGCVWKDRAKCWLNKCSVTHTQA